MPIHLTRISDEIDGEPDERLEDGKMRAAVDRMTRIALAVATGHCRPATLVTG